VTGLFDEPRPRAPLADALRPKTLHEVVGQEHLLGPGKPLRLAFESGKPHSMILWGPPGSGKTTIARLMADAFNAEFIALSAVLSGVKDIRDAVQHAREVLARSGRSTILTPLSPADLGKLFERAADRALAGLAFDPAARERIIGFADGDARRLLNLLEIIQTAAASGGVQRIDGAFVENAVARSLRRFDKGGEVFYDQISALHKSVRGSNPDAALYWLVRMLDGGADPLYLARRIIRMAAEDIGLADPLALALTLDAAETYERLGTPEGELALAQAVVYLACAAKSNAVYEAYNAARSFVGDDESRPVPLHLRNAPTRLMKELGYGREYRYAHDEAGAYAAGESYFPEGMPEVSWYKPTDRGMEARIAERLGELRALDLAARKR
jgi:putative ATPase